MFYCATCAKADNEEEESDGYEEANIQPIFHHKEVTLKEFYDVAMILKNAIKGVLGMDPCWPPSAVDLSTDQVLKMVPVVLFNFIAWMLGFSDYPEISSRLELEDSHMTKVLSICLDILYVASNGKNKLHSP